MDIRCTDMGGLCLYLFNGDDIIYDKSLSSVEVERIEEVAATSEDA